METKSQELFDEFESDKSELIDMLENTIKIVKNLDMNIEKLLALKERLNNNSFKLQVAGTFKNGKSTFINSILGLEVLPAYATPCTAVINELKWNDSKKAIVHFCNPLPQKLPENIPPETMRYIKKYDSKDIPPMEIPYDKVEDYVVIPMDSDPNEMLLESPYSKVEIFWPLDLLKNNVEIIDSPGLNEHVTRTRVAMDYLSKADAILLILNATQLCSQDEMKFIEEDLKDNGFDQPFFIVNRFDQIENDKDKDRLKKFAKNKLSNFTKDDQIYFVSAAQSLKAKKEKDDKKFEMSGMKKFEEELTEFLTKKRGKVKLSHPTQELKRIVETKAIDVISNQEHLLEHSLDDVKRMKEEIKPKLDKLREDKNSTQIKMKNDIEKAKLRIENCVRDNTDTIIGKIQSWVDGYELQTKFTLGIPSKGKLNDATKEISNYLISCIEEERRSWRKRELEPLISQQSQIIMDNAEDNISAIFDEIDAINMNISGGEVKSTNVPVWERIVGAAGGILLGDVGLAFSAGLNGLGKDFVKTLALQIGATTALGFLGLLNPATFFAVILGSGMFNIISAQKNITEHLKNEIANGTMEKIRNEKSSNAKEIADNYKYKFTELSDNIIKALDSEINETENQMNVIIAALEKGQEEVNKKKKMLDSCRSELKALNERLNGFIAKLINY